MFGLKIPSPRFIQVALTAPEKADFEGTRLVLTRGLITSLKKEWVDLWSDLDDITHNDILVLTLGISKEHSGVTAYGIQRKVVAEDVSIAYS